MLVISGSGEKLEQLVAFIQTNATILVQPPMPPEVLEHTLKNMHLFGFQKAKDRGTAQHCLLESFRELGGTVGDFFSQLDSTAAGEGGYVGNAFCNINGGRTPGQKNLDAEQCGAHVDTFTECKEAKPITARVIFYYMLDGRCATLRIIRGDIIVEIVVPRGCCLLATRALLTTMLHAHGANGRCVPQLRPSPFVGPSRVRSSHSRCVSLVYEVHRAAPLGHASLAEIEGAGGFDVQPSLDPLLLKYLNDWTPAKMFRGNKSAIGSGVGSKRRMVVAALAGPRGKRAEGTQRESGALRDARATSHEMTDEEAAKIAAAHAGELGARSPWPSSTRMEAVQLGRTPSSHHCRAHPCRAHPPSPGKTVDGKILWSPEDETRLLDAVEELGQQWPLVGARVGKLPDQCRHHFRALQEGEVKEGPWLPEVGPD